MVVENYGFLRVQSPKFLLHFSILLLIFFLLPPFAAPLSFNFTSFKTNDNNITYERSAYPADGVIQLTTNQLNKLTNDSIGRATYHLPMHLWDNNTQNLTDFTTHFSFVIDSRGGNSYGDGLAFFLAPQGSQIPVNATQGASFGLTNDDQLLNTTANTFLAVEFDIYPNPGWDPTYSTGTHVGIDIDSVRSVKTVSWTSDIPDAKRNDAWITYDSISKNLSVVFTGFENNTIVYQNISYQVDLRSVLPEWVTFGFSAATGSSSAIHYLSSWSFDSTLQIYQNTTNQTAPFTPSPNPRSKKSNVGLVVGLGVGGGFVLVGALSLVIFGLWRKRRRRENEDDFVFDETMADEFERGTGPKKFSYKELARATYNFAEAEKLGEGGFGGVYKGFIRELNSYVAVKRVSRGSQQGIKEYAAEVRIISRLRHKNLVQLMGWCHEKRELLLVYEFMPNDNLASHLFKAENLLRWAERYRIALGIASGLLYLHEEWEQCVVHRDIKPSNVMLDSNFNAKLGDFGLARLVDHGNETHTTVLAGTMGYMAPECLSTGKASKESDVYSFGIVALEIACGRRPIEAKAKEDQINMVEWVWGLYGMNSMFDAIDQRLSGEFDNQEMERLMIVGLWCAHPDNNSRPSIRQVIQVLNFEAPLPILPSQRPVLSYFGPPVNTQPSSSFYLSNNSAVSGSSGQTQSSISSGNTNSSSLTGSSSASAALLYSR